MLLAGENSTVLKERERKRGLGGGRGATMCHNKLQPSKAANAWRNIPLCLSMKILGFFNVIESQTWCFINGGVSSEP